MTRSPRPAKPSSPKKKAPATRPSSPERSVPDQPSRTITLSPAAIGMLEEMARESGMSKSGVVEELIERARSVPSPNVPPPAEPAPGAARAESVADRAPAREGPKKRWDDAIREFREMRARAGK
jgi:hypothetical protein